MAFNYYIAVFFSVIFFGKFLVVDSKLLVAVFDADEITYVNPFCEKQNVKGQADKSVGDFTEDNQSLNLTIDSFCNPPFQFEIFTWGSRITIEEPGTYVHQTPSLPESAKDRFYPPPRHRFSSR